jgi:hypothetical protein
VHPEVNSQEYLDDSLYHSAFDIDQELFEVRNRTLVDSLQSLSIMDQIDYFKKGGNPIQSINQ